jgi:uncharacterized membrane protein YqgA involved in biofilm formation
MVVILLSLGAIFGKICSFEKYNHLSTLTKKMKSTMYLFWQQKIHGNIVQSSAHITLEK